MVSPKGKAKPQTRGQRRSRTRGQAFTLESIVAAMLLVGGLVFALQATAVTPLSASTSSQHIENQHQATARGALLTAAEHGTLRVAVLNWNATGDRFYGASNTYFTDHPENAFGDLLDRAFGQRGIVYNVYVSYENEADEQRRQTMVYRGEPSDNAIIASVPVALYDDDERYNATESATGETINASSFYASDTAPGSGVYNVVSVELIVWRQ